MMQEGHSFEVTPDTQPKAYLLQLTMHTNTTTILLGAHGRFFINPRPPQWKLRVLTTGPPGKPYKRYSFFFFSEKNFWLSHGLWD